MKIRKIGTPSLRLVLAYAPQWATNIEVEIQNLYTGVEWKY